MSRPQLRSCVALGGGLAVTVAVFLLVWVVGIRYAYEPAMNGVMSRTRPSPEAYDVLGRPVRSSEAATLLSTEQGRAQLSPENGAVRIDDALLRLGRKSIYKETFGNEIFLSDVVGILIGPLRITEVTRAILKLKGAGTTNLRVQVPERWRSAARRSRRDLTVIPDSMFRQALTSLLVWLSRLQEGNSVPALPARPAMQPSTPRQKK
jgi:hypothetical protein